MKIKVERLSQRDWRWSWRRLGNSSSSIGGFGCYLTSLAMFMQAKGFAYGVPELNEKLKKMGGFSKDLIVPDGVLNILGPQWKFERKDWEKTKANINVIKELIDSGYPVITKVDFNPNTKNIEGHFVLVTGYVLENNKIVDLIANDPWTGLEIEICKVYPYLKLRTPETAVLGIRIYRQK